MTTHDRVGERGLLAGEDGQALVEFALIVPLLLILILGVVDLGKALGYKNDQTNLANQAARLAVVSSGTACQPCTGTQDIAHYIISQAPGELKTGTGSISARTEAGFTSPQTGLYITFTFPNMNGQPNSPCPNPATTTACGYCKGDPVQVTVLSTYNFLSFLVGQNTLPLSRPMSSSATMRMEASWDASVPLSGGHTHGFIPTNDMTGAKVCS